MLSIGKMAQGQSRYYTHLAREDYYLDGGEPPGQWHGQGAEVLGFTGEINGEELTQLFEGYHPHTGEALVEIQNGKGHRPGWDLTFSAPKSVSALWSQVDAPTREAIQKAHFEAVKDALNYLEDTCQVTRRGKGGVEHDTGKLVFATFEHGTSRAEDPQIHTHALALNLGVRGDGTLCTLDGRDFYREKMTAGAIYRASFSQRLESGLHLPIERRGDVFEVSGVPSNVMKGFSTRRAEIEEVLSQKGYDSPEAAAKAALSTRQVKGHAARAELFEKWQAAGKEYGWSQESVSDLLKERPRQRDIAAEKSKVLSEAQRRATTHESYFTRRQFTRLLAEEAQGRGVSAQDIREMARHELSGNSRETVFLGQQNGEAVFTTHDLLATEARLLAGVERSRDQHFEGSSRLVMEWTAKTKGLSGEQETAFRHITQGGRGRIRLVSGMAGTGKTTLLAAARSSWELSGYEVRGAALSGKAAEGLEAGAGIQSRTIHGMLLSIEKGYMELTSNTVLVIDEAGMVGTRQMDQLVSITEQKGATLILVGDARQLQPVDAGNPFREIQNEIGGASLTEIKRQRDKWARDAVSDFANGQAARGLRAYEERGLVEIAKTPQAAKSALIAQWKIGGIRAPDKHIILTGRRKDADSLNRMAQTERQQAGLLGKESLKVEGEGEFHRGDRVLFTMNSRAYGVKNGTLGEVIGIDTGSKILSVRTDSGAKVKITLEEYDHIKLGYAMTTHKGQGATLENAYVLAGGTMQDREISYVQMSRARGAVHVFAAEEDAGVGLRQLSATMSRSRQKSMAHEVRQSYSPVIEEEHDHGIGL